MATGSLTKNTIANYFGQLYAGIVSIVSVPFYLNLMGPEAFGVVGFFITLQILFSVLDIGLSPLVARQTARFMGCELDATSYRQLFRALEGVFFGVAIVGGGTLFLLSDTLSRDWFNSSMLTRDEVGLCLKLMAITVALRWVSGVYRAAFNGSERMVWLNVFNSVIATFRFILVIPVLIYVSSDIATFFIYQLSVAILEAAVIYYSSHKILPRISGGTKIKFSFAPLKSHWKFSMGIAFTTAVWVLSTQVDRLTLSKTLSLTDFGYFTLAVVVAGIVMMAPGPIATALTPRLTRLNSEGKSNEILRLYRQATQLIGIVTFPVAFILVMFANPVLYQWTGDAVAAEMASSVLLPYVLGHAILAVASCPFYLQFAMGQIKLHIAGAALNLVITVPALIWGSLSFGPVGAGYAWLLSRIAFILFWVPLIHGKLVPGLHRKWMLVDVVPLFAAAAGTSIFVKLFAEKLNGQGHGLVTIGVAFLLTSVVTIVASSVWRPKALVLLRGQLQYR